MNRRFAVIGVMLLLWSSDVEAKAPPLPRRPHLTIEREFCIDNLLVRIHFIIVMIRWTGLAPWEFEFPFPGSLTFTFLSELYPSARSAAKP